MSGSNKYCSMKHIDALSHEDFINLCYAVILNRMPDDNGRHHFSKLLSTGGHRKEVVLEILSSKEASARKIYTNGLFEYAMEIESVTDLLRKPPNIFIDCSYYIILGRKGDNHGRLYYLSRLADGNSKESVLYDMARSTEASGIVVLLPGFIETIKKYKSFFGKIKRVFRMDRYAEESLNAIRYSLENLTYNLDTGSTSTATIEDHGNGCNSIYSVTQQDNIQLIEGSCENKDKKIGDSVYSNYIKSCKHKEASINRMRLLVIRGDLNSRAGTARACKAYAKRMGQSYDYVCGVDIHYHEKRFVSSWTLPEITDDEIMVLISDDRFDISVTTISTPSEFIRFNGATNRGLFFWETDRMNKPGWMININNLDEVYVPIKIMINMLLREGCKIPIRHFPYPLDMLGMETGDVRINSTSGFCSDINLTAIDKHIESRRCNLEHISQNYDQILLSVNTNIPRKGIPILISEWAEIASRHPKAALILKTSSIDVAKSNNDVMNEILELASKISNYGKFNIERLFVITDSLEEEQMDELYRVAGAFVTTSFGEGYGLGVFEALKRGKVAICPRHTSFAEILPSDYRYFIDTDILNVGLCDPVGVYPISAKWGIPKESALVNVVSNYIEDIKTGIPMLEIRRVMQVLSEIHDK